LEKFHTIFISGDHGVHFSAIDTIINESKWSNTFRPDGQKIRIHLLFLCSYHAYNRCDGAGALTVVEKKRLRKLGIAPINAKEFAIAMDRSHHQNVQSWPFPYIDRSHHVFPWTAQKKITAQEKLRDKCEIRFDFLDEKGQISSEFGVALVRDVPGPFDKWDYLVVDLLEREKGDKMCKECSNRFQRPVRHHGAVCPSAVIIPLGNKDARLDDDRRSGYLTFTHTPRPCV
jgi:hypothetical protein